MTPCTSIVRDLLAGHVPADDSERESLRRIRDLVETASAPFSRAHFAPGHLTASGIVLNAERSRTLLIFHTKLQRWLQPGGHFEDGENDPSVAAAREVIEETGIATRWPGAAPLVLDVDVHLIPARKADPYHFHFDLRMLLIAEPGEIRVQEVAEARWCAPHEFDALKLDPGTIRALKKCGLSSTAL
ncbi:MAG: NUDIX domain-containing protein [Planctomycetota bacterium]